MIKEIRSLMALIQHCTDLPDSAANGNTDPSGTLDEGRVIASNILTEANECLPLASEKYAKEIKELEHASELLKIKVSVLNYTIRRDNERLLRKL